MHRPHVIIMLIVAVLSAITLLQALRSVRLSPYSDKPVCKRCNILLIDIDDFRADALPCMGYRLNTTDNICHVVEKGVLFTRNVSQSNFTLPSILSTVTSLYPSAHNVYSMEKQILDPQIITLAQLLKKEGYSTFFGGTPDEVYISENNRGIRGYDTVINKAPATPGELKDIWLRSLADASLKQPFFLHLNSWLPHVPYLHDPKKPYIETMKKPTGFPETEEEIDILMKPYVVSHYREIFTPQAIQENNLLFHNIKNIDAIYQFYKSIHRKDRERLLYKRWQNFMDVYVGYIRMNGGEATSYLRMVYDTLLWEIDTVVGSILDVVKEKNLVGNTIIIISSPHGEEFNEHGYFSHEGGNYNELIRTPLILYVPNVQHRIVNEVTQNIDLFPTLVDLIGRPKLSQFQGQSLLPLFRGEDGLKERYAVSEFDSLSDGITRVNGASIQDSTWKLISTTFESGSRSGELYNISVDPRERNNLFFKEATRAAQLSDILHTVLLESRNKGYRSNPPVLPSTIDENMKKRLQKGGYF